MRFDIITNFGINLLNLPILQKLMIKYILACQDEDGGFADRPGDVVG